MFSDLNQIAHFVLEAFLHTWPYLVLSIPLAVAVRMSDASHYIRRAFVGHPLKAILLATVIGAFSPFCSCGVIPIITSLLIAGVPLGPVMAFWIASPSMDPEIFLLSVGMIGHELAVARVVATLILSLSAGYIAHQLEQRRYFASGILREQRRNTQWSWRNVTRPAITTLRSVITPAQPTLQPTPAGATIALSSIESVEESRPVAVSTPESSCETGACATVPVANIIPLTAVETASCCASAPAQIETIPSATIETTSCCGDGAKAVESASSCATGTCGVGTASAKSVSRWNDLWEATRDTTLMIAKFMLIAYVLEALITLYVPQEAIINLLGEGNPLAIGTSALVGIPIYTSNLTALPLIGGLLNQGMIPGAALAFLIAGPTTTLPAMTAVFGIAKPRIFALYVAISLVGAIVLGYGYQFYLMMGAI